MNNINTPSSNAHNNYCRCIVSVNYIRCSISNLNRTKMATCMNFCDSYVRGNKMMYIFVYPPLTGLCTTVLTATHVTCEGLLSSGSSYFVIQFILQSYQL